MGIFSLPQTLILISSEVLATLAVLGSFTETLKPGLEVQTVDDPSSTATVVSCSQDSCQVSVDYQGNLVQVQVPKRRLEIAEKLDTESRNLFLSMAPEIIESLLQVLTSDELDPLSQPLPVQGPNLVLESSRLVAQIRTRSCQLVIMIQSS